MEAFKKIRQIVLTLKVCVNSLYGQILMVSVTQRRFSQSELMHAEIVKPITHSLFVTYTAGYMLKTSIIALLEPVFRFWVSTYTKISEQGT